MGREQLTARQSFFLLFLFMLGNLVTATGAKGMQAGWLLFLGLALLSVPLLLLYLKAAQQQSAGKVFITSLGKTVGGFITGIYCILAVLLAGDAIRLFADFIFINDLNDAGAWGNTVLLTLTVLFLLFCSIESLGKAAWAVQPITVGFLVLSLILTVGKVDLQRLLPVFAEDANLLARGSIGSFSAILAASFFPIFALSGSAPKNWRKSVLASGVTICILMSLITLRDAAVLGYPAVSMFRFPSFAAANILRHSEILISAVFVLSQPFRTALCLRYAQACLNDWLPRWSRWYPPVLLTLAVISGTLSWSSEQVRWRTVGESILTILLIAGPLAVVIVERIKEQRSRE